MGRAFHDSDFHTEHKHLIYLLREFPGGTCTLASPMQLDVYLPNVHGRRVVVDAKYKTRIETANLQQMVTYCLCKGVWDAVLVFPAGHLEDERTYVLAPPGAGAPIRIHLVELDVEQTRLAGWHEAARGMVAEVVRKVVG